MADITLRDVQATLVQANLNTLEEQEKQTTAIKGLTEQFSNFFKLEKRKALDELEAERERSRSQGQDSSNGLQITPNQDPNKIFDQLLIGTAAALAAASAFLDKGIRESIQSIMDSFLQFINNVQKIAFVVNQGLVLPIAGKVAKMLDNFRAGPIGKAIGQFFKLFSNTFKFIGGILGRATTLISGGMTALLPNIQFLKNIGRVFGKLFLPLTVFITAWDTIKGALDGYAEGGIIGGLEGAVKGFLTSLIGAPLDLLKDATAWILNKFGMEAAADMLNQFSFSEMLSDAVGSVFVFLKDLFTFNADDLTISGGISKLTDIVLAPLNLAINWIKGLFNLGDPDVPFKMSKFIADTAKGTIGYLGDVITSFIEQLQPQLELLFVKMVGMIRDIPDQLMVFLGKNLKFEIPPIKIDAFGKELTIFEGTGELRIPGSQQAEINLSERRAERELELMAIQRRIDAIALKNLREAGAPVGSSGNAFLNAPVDASTVNTSINNQPEFIPIVTDPTAQYN